MIVLAGGLAALLWTSSAVAEDWWSVADGVDGQQVSTDADSLRCQDEICSVWERTIYSKAGDDGVASLKDFAEYDCAKLATRTQREQSFDAAGRQLQDLSNGRSAWQTVKANAVGSSMMAFACSFSHYRSTAMAKGVIDIYGQRFVRVSQLGQPASGRPLATQRVASAAPAVLPARPEAKVDAPAKSAPLPVRTADRKPRPLPPAPVPERPSPRSRARVQVAASDTHDGAQKVVEALKRRGRLTGNLSGHIKSKNMNGRQFYRVQIAGFDSTHAARDFCRTVVREAPGCFVIAGEE